MEGAEEEGGGRREITGVGRSFAGVEEVGGGAVAADLATAVARVWPRRWRTAVIDGGGKGEGAGWAAAGAGGGAGRRWRRLGVARGLGP